MRQSIWKYIRLLPLRPNCFEVNLNVIRSSSRLCFAPIMTGYSELKPYPQFDPSFTMPICVCRLLDIMLLSDFGKGWMYSRKLSPVKYVEIWELYYCFVVSTVGMELNDTCTVR